MFPMVNLVEKKMKFILLQLQLRMPSLAAKSFGSHTLTSQLRPCRTFTDVPHSSSLIKVKLQSFFESFCNRFEKSG